MTGLKESNLHNSTKVFSHIVEGLQSTTVLHAVLALRPYSCCFPGNNHRICTAGFHSWPPLLHSHVISKGHYNSQRGRALLLCSCLTSRHWSYLRSSRLECIQLGFKIQSLQPVSSIFSQHLNLKPGDERLYTLRLSLPHLCLFLFLRLAMLIFFARGALCCWWNISVVARK